METITGRTIFAYKLNRFLNLRLISIKNLSSQFLLDSTPNEYYLLAHPILIQIIPFNSYPTICLQPSANTSATHIPSRHIFWAPS